MRPLLRLTALRVQTFYVAFPVRFSQQKRCSFCGNAAGPSHLRAAAELSNSCEPFVNLSDTNACLIYTLLSMFVHHFR